MLGILEKIRSKKKELTSNTSDAYFQLVREVAGGSEVDVEQAAIVIEAFGRDDASFEKDVEVQQERIGLASQLRYRHELEKRLPKLEQAERIASENYQRVVSEATSRLNEAKRAKRDVEHALLGLTQIEVRLRESCLDASLLQRETELNSLRIKLVQQLKPLQEDVSRSAGMIQSHEFTIKALEKKSTDKLINPVGRASYKKELDENSRALAHERHIHTQLTRAIADIDSELCPLDQELGLIRLKKLEV
jgi:hypothetical protein